jgi:hypothetical protein
MFDSSIRSAGDLAGVFEFDGATCYFYLYETGAGSGHKVVDSIHVLSGRPDFGETEIAVRWDLSERTVGLFIRGVLWAAFDCDSRLKGGGGYTPGGEPRLPAGMGANF